MDEQILDAPSSVGTKLNYAGFWIRFAAYFIDAVILSIVQFALAFLFVGDSTSIFAPNLTVQLFSVVLGIAYFAGMESSSRQATLGKMGVGIKVGNAQGQQISFVNALGRYLGKILSALILLIGFMMAGWDSKKQALHDKLAGTYVFYK
ncbi:MAG TPA: RDD family protein [Chryseosolibacter sp.]|nr:RDD family protein [Chryseosolibacter sp.]